jgi:hypothetical protein
VDFLTYPASVADRAFGLLADGQPFNRGPLGTPSPAGANGGTVSETPLLSADLLTGREVRITWIGKPGVRYRLEAADDLAKPTWTPVFNAVGDGATLSVQVPTTSAAQRYFRVAAE